MTYPANLLVMLYRSYSAQDVKTTPVVGRAFDHRYIAICTSKSRIAPIPEGRFRLPVNRGDVSSASPGEGIVFVNDAADVAVIF